MYPFTRFAGAPFSENATQVKSASSAISRAPISAGGRTRCFMSGIGSDLAGRKPSFSRSANTFVRSVSAVMVVLCCSLAPFPLW